MQKTGQRWSYHIERLALTRLTCHHFSIKIHRKDYNERFRVKLARLKSLGLD